MDLTKGSGRVKSGSEGVALSKLAACELRTFLDGGWIRLTMVGGGIMGKKLQ